ncbi:ABC transporter A family member 7-like [Nymphaea colorata]|nr:ABC transporter A family member 7-like [Nymphaea colorata]
MAEADGRRRISLGPPTFWTQANALLRKNFTFQKRNYKTNFGLIIFPVVLCLILFLIQKLVDQELDKSKYKCGCKCVDTSTDGSCRMACGIQYSTLDQASSCPIPNPPKWPALMQIPLSENRAVRSDSDLSLDLPDSSCKQTQSCPVTVLFTGGNKTLANRVAENFFTNSLPVNLSDLFGSLANLLLGTSTTPLDTQFIEPAFLSESPLYIILPQCPENFSFPISIPLDSTRLMPEVKCVKGLNLWRNNSLDINAELCKGYRKGNTKKETNEFVAAYDLLDTNENRFSIWIWYNSTYKEDLGMSPMKLLRISRSLNMASNAYLQFLKGAGVKIPLQFVEEMPKSATQAKLSFSSLLGGLFFSWVIELLFPVMVTYLVYEKQRNLRIMMKMHGLGDGPYWLISYSYFLFISFVYMFGFVFFGSIIGLDFFRVNDYSLQFVLYFIYINLQIMLAFLASSVFSDVKTATVVCYIYVFGSGFLGMGLFQVFVEDETFPRKWVVVMELIPAFSLYRGLYELGQHSFIGQYMATKGMQWEDLNRSGNGMKAVLVIMIVEWFILLPVAYYLDQVVSAGSGVKKHPLFFLKSCQKRTAQTLLRPNVQRQGSNVVVDMEKPDVCREREVVEELLLSSHSAHSIICDSLKKVYPGKDGNPEKHAVRGLSLALPRGECFGMLGPNGAGKTTFINMMIGLISPTAGTAYIRGFDIRKNMDKIYTSMGVCPQHNLIWETLTGREHLLFYGRLKNLKGSALSQAVEESLKSVNLFNGGVGDKLSRKYSGGMKRRLSVAISLIGDPEVVYMDEPSTGLDPASRNNLWSVVKRAKQDRAIILTTHSMEEAEVLCDRLGIFVDGDLQCIGNPKELKARYGGSYVFTMTTSADQEEEVENLVRQLAPTANKIYHLSGTQKFELPKQDVKIAEVFKAVERAKRKLIIQAWGLADTTLEDVFIKVARRAESFTVLP